MGTHSASGGRRRSGVMSRARRPAIGQLPPRPARRSRRGGRAPDRWSVPGRHPGRDCRLPGGGRGRRREQDRRRAARRGLRRGGCDPRGAGRAGRGARRRPARGRRPPAPRAAAAAGTPVGRPGAALDARRRPPPRRRPPGRRAPADRPGDGRVLRDPADRRPSCCSRRCRARACCSSASSRTSSSSSMVLSIALGADLGAGRDQFLGGAQAGFAAHRPAGGRDRRGRGAEPRRRGAVRGRRAHRLHPDRPDPAASSRTRTRPRTSRCRRCRSGRPRPRRPASEPRPGTSPTRRG